MALLLLALVRFGWGRYMGAQVEAQRADAKRRGEPITASEVKLSDVTDATNAWTLQSKAAAAAVPGVDSFRTSNLEGTSTPPYGPKWVQLAEGSESVNGVLFALARQARAFPNARMRDELNPDPKALIFTGLNRARNLANLLADGAQLMELRRRHAEAVERVRDLLHLARSLRQDPYLVSQLVAIGIEALACDSAQIIAPGLDLHAGEPGATRAAVKALIIELLDEKNLADSMRNSLVVERLMLAHMLGTEGGQRHLIRPLADRALTQSNLITGIAIEAAAAPDAPTASAILARTPSEPAINPSPFGSVIGVPANRDVPRYSRWFDWASTPYYDKLLDRHFQNLSERRLTAVILASHLFRADRDRWPEKLEDLVPAYLPAIPRDPFRTGSPPVGYVILRKALPDHADRPLVYTEPGAIDDEDAAHWHSPLYGWQQGLINGRAARVPIRQYRDLARFRFPDVAIKETGGAIAPRPGGGFGWVAEPDASPEGVDNDPNKSDAPGKEENK